jgi:hypothetical protein
VGRPQATEAVGFCCLTFGGLGILGGGVRARRIHTSSARALRSPLRFYASKVRQVALDSMVSRARYSRGGTC